MAGDCFQISFQSSSYFISQSLGNHWGNSLTLHTCKFQESHRYAETGTRCEFIKEDKEAEEDALVSLVIGHCVVVDDVRQHGPRDEVGGPDTHSRHTADGVNY